MLKATIAVLLCTLALAFAGHRRRDGPGGYGHGPWNCPTISCTTARVCDKNKLRFEYDISDKDSEYVAVDLYVVTGDEWVRIQNGLTGDIGANVSVGSNKTFEWEGAISGDYWFHLRATDKKCQGRSDPMYLQVTWPRVMVSDAVSEDCEDCAGRIPYIPYSKVITWYNIRGEVTDTNGRTISYEQDPPAECNDLWDGPWNGDSSNDDDDADEGNGNDDDDGDYGRYKGENDDDNDDQAYVDKENYLLENKPHKVYKQTWPQQGVNHVFVDGYDVTGDDDDIYETLEGSEGEGEGEGEGSEGSEGSEGEGEGEGDNYYRKN